MENTFLRCDELVNRGKCRREDVCASSGCLSCMNATTFHLRNRKFGPSERGNWLDPVGPWFFGRAGGWRGCKRLGILNRGTFVCVATPGASPGSSFQLSLDSPEQMSEMSEM